MTEATALIVSTAHGFGSASNHRGRRSAPSPPSLLRTEMRPHRTAANAEIRAPTRRDRCRPRRPPPALSTHLGASNTAPTPGARPGTQHAPPQPGTQLRTPAPSSGPHDAPRHPAHRRRIPSRTSGAARPPPRPIKHLRTPTRGQPPARARRSPGRPAWSGAELHRVPVLLLLARAQPRPDRPGVLEAEQAAGPAPPETPRPSPMT